MARLPRICPPTGKRIYTRHQEAAKEVGRFPKARIALAHAPQSAYRCEHCRRWHLTSYTPEHNRNLQKAKKRKADAK